MRNFRLLLGCVLLTACSRGTTGTLPSAPNPAAGTSAFARSGTAFKSLYAFQGAPDGANPYGGLTSIGSVLYGTTNLGGAKHAGTVFTLTRAGTETLLHTFSGGADGAKPIGSLIEFDAVLYGTTYVGGGSSRFSGNGCGTVFKIGASGTESVLYAFKGGSDGEGPAAGLIEFEGTLYGTTYRGGGSGCFGGGGCGTVFKITPAGTESVIYSFKGGSDGAFPVAPLLDVAGTLYGTTFGGDSGDYGTVFKIAPSGAESVLHRFAPGADGANPQAGLISVDGALYGVTLDGGGSGCAGYGCGTVFKIAPSGKESIVYRFTDATDGAHPAASNLLDFNGALYGTTSRGGGKGFGTIFKLTTTGAESVLYRFAQSSNGAEPLTGLTRIDGTLYGTTYYGGRSRKGTVFALTL